MLRFLSLIILYTLPLLGTAHPFTLEFYRDLSQKQNIDQIVKAPFIPLKNHATSLGFTQDTYWGRIHVKNDQVSSKTFYLEHQFQNIHNIHFYAVSSDGQIVKKIETGILHPVSSRDLNRPRFTFSFTIPPKNHYTIYIKIKTESTLSFNLNLYDDTPQYNVF